MVYQAFETLADPEARKRYDNNQLEGPKKAKKQKMRPKKSAANPKDCAQRPAKQTSFAKPQVSEKKKLSQADVQKASVDKLLAKLYAILKVLPRDVRNEVISKEFSQKQRVLFEEWIVNQREAETQHPSVPMGEEATQQSSSTPSLTNEPPKGSCTALTLKTPNKGVRRKRRKQKGNMKGISRASWSSYRTNVMLDKTLITTRECDLPTAVEYLVILTSMKQKMNGGGSLSAASASFESRLQEALEQSAQEHGRRGSRNYEL